MSKSSDFYTKSVSKYHKDKSDAIAKGTFKYEFWVTALGGIETYLKSTETDDIISKLKQKKPKGVSVEDWSPQKLEGFHANHLEKAMRIRYSSYGGNGMSNSYGSYQVAAEDQQNKYTMAKEFDKQAFKWS